MAIMIALLLAAPGISIDVEPGCACVTIEGLRRQLKSMPNETQLNLRKVPGGVRVEAQLADGRRMSREVPTPLDECPAVEQLIALLVTTWGKERGLPRTPSAVSAPDAGRAPAATAGTPSIPQPEPISQVSPPPEEEVESAPPLSAEVPAPLEQPVDAGTISQTERPEPGAGSGSWLPGIQLVVRGGLSGRTPPSTVPAAELALTVTWKSLGLSLSGGLSGSSHSAFAPGVISISAAWGSLGAAATIPLNDRIALEAALGARLLALSVSSSGFSQSGEATLVSAGAFIELGMSFRIAGPLMIGLWGTASVRSHDERLVIGNLAGGLTVPRWQFSLLAGPGVQWR